MFLVLGVPISRFPVSYFCICHGLFVFHGMIYLVELLSSDVFVRSLHNWTGWRVPAAESWAFGYPFLHRKLGPAVF